MIELSKHVDTAALMAYFREKPATFNRNTELHLGHLEQNIGSSTILSCQGPHIFCVMFKSYPRRQVT